MIERIEAMPAGALGLRASGKLTAEDYREVLEPALEEAVAAGSVRLVFVLTEFDGVAPGAWVEDIRPASAPGSATTRLGGGWPW